MKKCVMVLAGLMLSCPFAYADSWALKPEKKDTEFTFGDSRIVLHYDSTQDQTYPKYGLSIYLKDKLVAKHEGVGFQQVFASPDNAYFLGVSNRGLIEPAYVIFDRNGRVRKKEPHLSRSIRYFERSKSLIRKWYDQDKPQAAFFVADGRLRDVCINACDGSPVSLMIPEDLGLRTFLLEDLLKTHAKPKEICYVAFREQLDAKTRKMVYSDPPQGFLDGFKNRPYQLKPASAYLKPQPAGPLPAKNPETGIPDGIYTVEIIRWLDGDTAKVRAGMYRNGLWASGMTLVVERRDGKWRVKQQVQAWRS